MNNFWKMVWACVIGFLLAIVITSFVSTCTMSAFMASLFSKPAVKVPEKALLDIDMSKLSIEEQTLEPDPLAELGGNMQRYGAQMQEIRTVGILDAINALDKASNDPRITACYIRPDAAADISHIEEFRKAVVKFHESGKPVYAYIETPTNVGFWLASAADRIFMSEYHGGMNMMIGLGGSMVYFKDLLDKLGVNVQLIRHGKYKSAGEPFIRSTPSKENLEQQTAMINGLWKEMATQMADRASMTFEQFNAMIDNLELCMPSDFLAKGLVDETTGLAGIKKALCNLMAEDKFDNIPSISLADYVTATALSNYSRTADNIAIIYADGEIIDGYADDEVAGKTFVEIIDEVRNDDSVKGVVLRVNSPGGSVIASSQIKEAVDALREVKPVVASYGSYAASGGYWISACSDYIFSNATTLTGSIGVFGIIPDFSKTVKDFAHVNITNVMSNKHSDMYSMMRPLSNEELAFTQKDIEAIYAQFTELVAGGRKKTVEEVDAVGQGRVWTGREAKELGLVDEIGGLKDAVEYTANLTGCPSYNIVSYPKPLTTIEQLMSAMNTNADDKLVKIYKKIEECRKVEILARMPYRVEIR